MAPQTRGGEDYSQIAIVIQSTMEPLISKLGNLDTKIDRLELKVNHLSENRVTREEVEKLRSELLTSMVPRDSYEARHAALIQRAADIETRLRKHEDDVQLELQRLHERLESGKQQIEDRIREHENKMEEKLKEHKNTQLSDEEKKWMRATQIFSIIAVLISIVGYLIIPLIGHIKFQ